MKKYKRLFSENDIPEMKDFIMSLNKVIEKVSKYSDAQLDEFPDLLYDIFEGQLDEPVIRMIDGLIGNMKKIGISSKRDIDRVLDKGNQRFGTEPRAAISAAVSLLSMLIRKM